MASSVTVCQIFFVYSQTSQQQQSETTEKILMSLRAKAWWLSCLSFLLSSWSILAFVFFFFFFWRHSSISCLNSSWTKLENSTPGICLMVLCRRQWLAPGLCHCMSPETKYALCHCFDGLSLWIMQLNNHASESSEWVWVDLFDVYHIAAQIATFNKVIPKSICSLTHFG